MPEHKGFYHANPQQAKFLGDALEAAKLAQNDGEENSPGADQLQESIKDGTRLSGFVTAEENQPPRECGNCRWFTESSSCIHPVVKDDPELADRRQGDDSVQVDPDDCCDFFQSAGGSEEGPDEDDDEGDIEWGA